MFIKTLVSYITLYKSQFPRKGILQIAEQLPQFIENYNGRIHSTTRRSPDEAWAENVICKNRDSLNETGKQEKELDFKLVTWFV